MAKANIWEIDIKPNDGIKFIIYQAIMDNGKKTDFCDFKDLQKICVTKRRNALGNIWNFETYNQH